MQYNEYQSEMTWKRRQLLPTFDPIQKVLLGSGIMFQAFASPQTFPHKRFMVGCMLLSPAYVASVHALDYLEWRRCYRGPKE